jgi:SAM-dependent methyltransferase
LSLAPRIRHRLARRLAGKLRYTNTFYHQAPKLDIQSPPAEYLGRFRFVISSDVFEHVAPPIERAFDNLHRILAPGGVLVLTVPFTTEGGTVEHFPELHDYTIAREGDAFVLTNRTVDGRQQTFRDLVFHGGPGTTLEMRLFSEADLRRHLADAGFSDVQVHREPAFEFGIYWPEPWSVPITARA